jgi:predicted signal transduction protein with EAL and GGDEF domain
MEAPFTIEGELLNISLSIGISIDEGFDNRTAEELLKFADIAMYRSKSQGRGRISFFEEAMHEQTKRRLILENGIANALKDNEFYLIYQPVFQTQTRKLTGFEALIRWQSSSGLIPPDEFIPIAEKSFQIITIGRWVVSQAIQQISVWNKSRNQLLKIAINLSPAQLCDSEFVVIVKSLCKRYEVAPECIEFELTETAILESNEQTLAFLDDLVRFGCSLALDDFGTGYSSIAHLSSIPLSAVKLDKSLLPIESSPDRVTALITGLVYMLKTLNLNIVAEGVETEAHEKLCKTLNVTSLQGFYYDPGLNVADIHERYIK